MPRGPGGDVTDAAKLRSNQVAPWPYWQAAGLGRSVPNAYNHTMADPSFSEPLDWRAVKAPSLDEIELIAVEAYRRLPTNFRDLCEDLCIRVEDFPTDDVLDQMEAETEFDLLGLFQGVGLP